MLVPYFVIQYFDGTFQFCNLLAEEDSWLLNSIVFLMTCGYKCFVLLIATSKG